jgi:hypothetical protein
MWRTAVGMAIIPTISNGFTLVGLNPLRRNRTNYPHRWTFNRLAQDHKRLADIGGPAASFPYHGDSIPAPNVAHCSPGLIFVLPWL